MNLQERMQQIASIKEIIQQKISHNYLKQFIDDPFIDEDRILILVESLMDYNLSHKDLERFVTTAMLIQIALDTHEKVTNIDGSLKQRQLTVLAGDYFSGLYYKILAEVENVPLIRTLAEGIKLVNEYKISLYRIDDLNIESYMNDLKKAESTIVTRCSQFFGTNPVSVLGEELLFLNRLLREKENVLQGKSSIYFEALKKFFLPAVQTPFQQLTSEKKTLLLHKCENYIEQSIQLIIKTMGNVPKLNQLLDQRISNLLNQHHAVSNLYAEEG